MMYDANISFRDIFRKYYPKMLLYAQSLVGRDLAEDVVGDVFTDIWARRNDLTFGDDTLGLLMRSVYNRCINVLKHNKVEKERIVLLEDISSIADAEFDVDCAEFDAEPSGDGNDVRNQIFQAIDSLPEGSREVFRMSYIYDMRNSEIARVKGISVRTVEAHIYKSLKILRQKLKNLSNYSFFLSL
ncbi:MAG: RNA polymerase sigma-70 factor [Muribaculaceae bacterium]